jgi:hypothetical protein
MWGPEKVIAWREFNKRAKRFFKSGEYAEWPLDILHHLSWWAQGAKGRKRFKEPTVAWEKYGKEHRTIKQANDQVTYM